MSKPLSILILDNTYAFGGAIRSLGNLLRAFDKDRFEPVLVTGQSVEFLAEHFECTWYHYVPSRSWQDNQMYKKVAALTLFRILIMRKILNLLFFLYWAAFVTIPEAIKFFRLGRKHNVALVHLNNIMGCQIAGILAAKLLHVPCVAHLRDFETVDAFTRFYARHIDHHVAISVAIRDNLRQLGVPDERITVIHDGLELTEFQATVVTSRLAEEFGLITGQLVFGIFGRVVEWKGIREFILAARAVLDAVPEARAFIVGSHSDGDENFFLTMQKLVSDLGLAGKVVFTGYRDDVPDLMRMMDVIVHASVRPEPFGMVVIEGMAMKKPVVATHGGGVLDIIVDGETGLLVEMGDAEALGRAIISLLNQRDLRWKMGTAGLARVSHMFTSRRCASEMATIYHKLAVGV